MNEMEYNEKFIAVIVILLLEAFASRVDLLGRS